ncbi:MAG: diguanylate cyclase [Crocosphaera sp.]|nr:diguanylate cyclase [Crocosphaera sp.]
MKPKNVLPNPKVSLRTTLIISLVVQIITAVGLTGWLSFRYAQKSVNELVTRISDEVTAKVKKHIKTFAEKPYEFLQINVAAIESRSLDLSDYPTMARYFWKQTQISQAVPYVYFANQQGDFVGVWQQREDFTTLQLRNQQTSPHREMYQLDNQGNPTKLIKRIIYDPRQRPWYQTAIKEGKPSWTSIYVFATSPRLGITHAIPVYDQSQKVLGVLAADLTLSDISHFLKQIKVGYSGEIFIIERSGEIVASSADEPPFLNSETGQKRLAAVQSSNIVIQETAQNLLMRFDSFENIDTSKRLMLEIEDQPQFLQVTPIQDTHGLYWLMVVVIPKADFTKEIDINIRNMVILCVVALAVAIASSIITSRWITAPVIRISQASKQLAQGNLEQQLKPSFIVEIDTLAQSFNMMSAQLKASFDSLHESEVSLEEANQKLEQKVAEKTASLELKNHNLQETLKTLEKTQLELEKANKKLKKLAGIDALTQVANRRQFNQLLEEKWQHCRREQLPLSLILGDVDFFKSYNDLYGHPAGDRCLFEIAQAMVHAVKRSTDLVARYGGEEFVIILPNTNLQGSVEVATLIQTQVKKLKIIHQDSQVSSFVTMSLGVATVVPQQKLSPKMLIKAADEALYQAKEEGRDRIIAKLV